MAQGSDQPVRVAVLVDEDSNPFEVGCVCEVFGARRRADLGRELYDLQVVAPGGRAGARDGLFTFADVGDLDAIDDAHTVVVPNSPHVRRPHHPTVLAAIRRAHSRGARLIGLCTGAFTLAEAGVLAGRPATVHWQLAEEFRRRFPDVVLQPDLLFVDDGDVLTSAGSAAALDLALHVVRRDHGAEAANSVSRRLVFATYRDGGQRQFVERPVPTRAEQPLTATLAWAQDRLGQPLPVAALARHAHVSVTTLHRRFRAELGTTPLAWVTGERVDLARRLLERGVAIETVAHQSGLGTSANLRAQLRRHTGLTPGDYRARFAAGRH